MATGKRPDGDIFAGGAKEGEVLDFPSVARGWGVTVDGQDADGNSVTDPTNGIPPMEWFNSLLQRTDQNIWWLLQNALPDWLTGTWPKGAVVVNGDIVWRAQKETATEPTSSNGDWLALFPLQNLDGRYVPQTRKINGHALGSDANVTAQDIFNGQAVAIGNAVDLNTLTTPGLYFQAANAQATTGKNYPETVAGSLEVYKHAGITQIYRTYNNSRCYIRTLYGGAWTAWAKQYDTANKPTAADVGALPITGGTLNGNLTVQNTIQIGSIGKAILNIGDNDSGLRSSKDGQVDLWANSKMLGYWNTTTFSFTGQIIPGNYANFDAKYQAKGNYTPAGQAYTKAESDGRYQAKGNYTPAGQAYTKAESDGRYLQDVRLGGQGSGILGNPNPYQVPAGCVMTGWYTEGSNPGGDTIYYKPIQKYKNGAWVTISG
ncbi:pyocin knob domain-containing protein [Enterobacter cancerogenus]